LVGSRTPTRRPSTSCDVMARQPTQMYVSPTSVFRGRPGPGGRGKGITGQKMAAATQPGAGSEEMGPAGGLALRGRGPRGGPQKEAFEKSIPRPPRRDDLKSGMPICCPTFATSTRSVVHKLKRSLRVATPGPHQLRDGSGPRSTRAHIRGSYDAPWLMRAAVRVDVGEGLATSRHA